MRIECPDRTTMALERLAQPRGQASQRCGIIHGGQSPEIAIVGGLRGLGAAWQICDALAHPLPGFFRLRFALRDSERLEVSNIVDCRLDPQHAALLIVHLDCVLAEAVLDPHEAYPVDSGNAACSVNHSGD